MKKFLLIGLKDLKLVFRDKTALIFMLLAPFLLTLGLGFVTGQFYASGGGIGNIPVVLVNLDEGELGEALVTLFESEELSELVSVGIVEDETVARQQVEENLVAAAVIIPAGFTESIIPPEGQSQAGELRTLEVIGNPTSPVSVGVIKTILEEFISQLEVGRISGTVAVTQLVANGLIAPGEIAQVAAEIGQRQAGLVAENPAITLTSNIAAEEANPFNPLAYIAPGMALMFLMYTVSNGGRTLLVERNQGTLPRLLISPTHSAQVLGGKIFGVYLSGVAQMLILIGGSSLFFQLKWGDPVAVFLLVLAAVFGACGWGMLVTALAKRPGQIAAIGSALMLTFGILGGTFIQLDMMPVWLRWLSRITPNAWGLDGFTTLALGGDLGMILEPILALLVMGGILFAISLAFFNRRGMTIK